MWKCQTGYSTIAAENFVPLFSILWFQTKLLCGRFDRVQLLRLRRIFRLFSLFFLGFIPKLHSGSQTAFFNGIVGLLTLYYSIPTVYDLFLHVYWSCWRLVCFFKQMPGGFSSTGGGAPSLLGFPGGDALVDAAVVSPFLRDKRLRVWCALVWMVDGRGPLPRLLGFACRRRRRLLGFTWWWRRRLGLLLAAARRRWWDGG